MAYRPNNNSAQAWSHEQVAESVDWKPEARKLLPTCTFLSLVPLSASDEHWLSDGNDRLDMLQVCAYPEYRDYRHVAMYSAR